MRKGEQVRNHKYVKRIPLGNGKYRHVYDDGSKAKKSAYNNQQANIAYRQYQQALAEKHQSDARSKYAVKKAEDEYSTHKNKLDSSNARLKELQTERKKLDKKLSDAQTSVSTIALNSAKKKMVQARNDAWRAVNRNQKSQNLESKKNRTLRENERTSNKTTSAVRDKSYKQMSTTYDNVSKNKKKYQSAYKKASSSYKYSKAKATANSHIRKLRNKLTKLLVTKRKYS